jgi:uncharacterized protein (DUF111 family)
LGVARIREDADVLDIVTWPVLAKKGRLATHVQVLARATATRRVADLCFAETTTLGVRIAATTRMTLARRSSIVEVEGQEVRVKEATSPRGTSQAKPEMDDLARAGNREARERVRAAALDAARKMAP